MTAMNPIRLSADMLHLASILILLLKIYSTKSCRGISLKTQQLYFLVFVARYLDLFWNHSVYNSIMKIIFIGTTGAIVYLMQFKEPYKNTYEAAQDSFPILYLIIPCFLLGLFINVGIEVYMYDEIFYISEVFWTFSIYLEAVAILPQLWVVHDFAKENRGFVENLTSHYVFALGGYRALYMLNWVYRFFTEIYYRSWIVWIGGIIQTAIYCDFFYYYIKARSEGKVMSLPI